MLFQSKHSLKFVEPSAANAVTVMTKDLQSFKNPQERAPDGKYQCITKSYGKSRSRMPTFFSLLQEVKAKLQIYISVYDTTHYIL